MNDLIDTILNLLAKGEDLVLARVISVKGSSPREAGAVMLMSKNGGITGTVGGGLIEAAIMDKGRELFASRGWAKLEFDMTGDDIKTADMVCGGNMEVMVELIPACADTMKLFADMNENRCHNRTSYLVTKLPDAGSDYGIQRKLLSVGGLHDIPAKPNLLEEAIMTLVESGVVHVEEGTYWVDVIKPRGIVYIMGAGHISREVSDLAQRVGFTTVVMDDRSEYANRERFGKAAEIVVLKSFEGCFEGFCIDDNSYIVIVTRGHGYDKKVLEQALRTRAGYVGMIGSIRKRDAIYRSLVEEGITTEQIKQVYCPIGLKMDSETPAEIAVSIVGELINVRAEKNGKNKMTDTVPAGKMFI
jgi:xanthine dehydrogenase accessory factor